MSLGCTGGLRDMRWYMWWPALGTLAGTPFLLALLLIPSQLAALLVFIPGLGLGAGPQTAGILNDLLDPVYGDHAIRYSLLIVGLINVAAAVLFFLAARTLRDDLRAKEA